MPEAANTGQAAETGQAANTGQAAETGQAANTGQAAETGQAANTGQAARTGQAGQTTSAVRGRSWFLLSAVGRDRPGIVADLAQLIFDSEGNLEDSRMALLGNEFAAILLCSGRPELGERLQAGARRLEWENRLTIFIRPLEGEPRPAVPAPGTRLFRVRAEGEDRAGIVARICRVLADQRVNIADLESASLPTPSGAVLYRMTIRAEVPEDLSPSLLGKALDEAGAAIGVDVILEAV